MNFTLKLAGVAVGVSCIYASTKSFCQDYFSNEKPAFTVALSEQGLAFERAAYTAEKKIETEISDCFLEPLALCRAIAEELIDYNTLLFHGSAVAVNGQAYLFAAPSGTGKSTHTKLWREVLPKHGCQVFMINDDKPLLKVTNDTVYVCGTPWNGAYRLDTNIVLPLKGLCVLRRANENQIQKISYNEAFQYLYAQSYRSNRPKRLIKTLDLIEGVAKNTKLYQLGCNCQEAAALISFNEMSRDK